MSKDGYEIAKGGPTKTLHALTERIPGRNAGVVVTKESLIDPEMTAVVDWFSDLVPVLNSIFLAQVRTHARTWELADSDSCELLMKLCDTKESCKLGRLIEISPLYGECAEILKLAGSVSDCQKLAAMGGQIDELAQELYILGLPIVWLGAHAYLHDEVWNKPGPVLEVDVHVFGPWDQREAFDAFDQQVNTLISKILGEKPGKYGTMFVEEVVGAGWPMLAVAGGQSLGEYGNLICVNQLDIPEGVVSFDTFVKNLVAHEHGHRLESEKPIDEEVVADLLALLVSIMILGDEFDNLVPEWIKIYTDQIDNITGITAYDAYTISGRVVCELLSDAYPNFESELRRGLVWAILRNIAEMPETAKLSE
jgi:hypothetical protein